MLERKSSIMQQRSGAKPNRREAKKAENRGKLLTAARQLFLENNFLDVGPKDISELADLGYGTFYSFFEDKYQCLQAVIDEMTEEFLEDLETELRPISGLRARAEHMTSSLIDFAYDNPPLIQIMLNESGIMQSRGDTAEKEPFVDSFSREMARLLETGPRGPAVPAVPNGYILAAVFSGILSVSRSRVLDRTLAKFYTVKHIADILQSLNQEAPTAGRLQ